MKKGVKNLQNSQKKPSVLGYHFQEKCSPEACNLIKREIPTQVFSCEFCKIFKNSFNVDTSVRLLLYLQPDIFLQYDTIFHNTTFFFRLSCNIHIDIIRAQVFFCENSSRLKAVNYFRKKLNRLGSKYVTESNAYLEPLNIHHE